MADRCDVSARLAEGRPAVEHTQTYVDACRQLGYQQPDLTAHPSQVLDWYDAEAGLDLRILDDDTGALRAAVNAIEEALWVQRTQVTELAAAWRGSGADTAMRFLQRHCDVAAQVAAHVGAAAEHYAALRDDVWKSVDGKVANAAAIDERRTAERPSWLAACHSVTAGTGDRSTAEEVIRQQVKPYVDNDIRNDWLAAMGAGSASVAAAYDKAIHALASTSEVRFDIPGDFGPRWQPAVEERPVSEATPVVALPAEPAPTVPAAAPAARPATSPEPQGFSTDMPDDAASMPTELAAPLGDASGLSTGAGNLGGLGGIAIAIGAMVDAAIVMIENAHKHLERAQPGTPRVQVLIAAASEVGPALFFSLLIITVSFLPIFSLEAQEGRLFKPLAYTKTFSMAAAALLSVTLVPALAKDAAHVTMLSVSDHPNLFLGSFLILGGGASALLYGLFKR